MLEKVSWLEVWIWRQRAVQMLPRQTKRTETGFCAEGFDEAVIFVCGLCVYWWCNEAKSAFSKSWTVVGHVKVKVKLGPPSVFLSFAFNHVDSDRRTHP